MTRRVNVIGVEMSKFTKPGDSQEQDYHLIPNGGRSRQPRTNKCGGRKD
jgi:hypothetical protein